MDLPRLRRGVFALASPKKQDQPGLSATPKYGMTSGHGGIGHAADGVTAHCAVPRADFVTRHQLDPNC
ncbi:hypothetical protein [Nocardia sp. NPDC052566]|uniref:hypothetical protein n=1 Tax=Nocardia sp. NPDC052566 TaxID=3364330 RepID=UPI0037CA9341